MPGRKRSGTDGGVSAKKRPRVQSKRTRLQNLLDPDSSEEDEFFAGEAPSQQDDGDMESATSQLVSHSSSSIEPYEDPFGGEAARSFTETRQRTESPTSGGSNGCEDSQGDVSHRLEMTLMSATSSSSASDPLHQLDCVVDILDTIVTTPGAELLVQRIPSDFSALIKDIVIKARPSPYGTEVYKMLFQAALHLVVWLCSTPTLALILHEALSSAVFIMLETALVHNTKTSLPRSSAVVPKKLKSKMKTLFKAIMTGPLLDGRGCPLVEVYGAPSFQGETPSELGVLSETVPSLLMHCVACMLVYTDADVLGRIVSSSHSTTREKSFAKMKDSTPDTSSVTSRSEVINFIVQEGRLQTLLLILRECSGGAANVRVFLRAVYILQLISCYLSAIPETREAVSSAVCDVFCAGRALATPLSAGHLSWLHDRMGLALLHITQGIPSTQLHAMKHILCTDKVFAAVQRSLSTDLTFFLASRDEEGGGDAVYDRICVFLNILPALVESRHSLTLTLLASDSDTQTTETAETADNSDSDTPPEVLFGLDHLSSAFYVLRESTRVDESILCSYIALVLGTASLCGMDNRVAVRNSLINVKEGNGESLRGSCPDAQENNPMADLCATLQQFILFQSKHGLLTAQVCEKLVSLDNAMIHQNGLRVDSSAKKTSIQCP